MRYYLTSLRQRAGIGKMKNAERRVLIDEQSARLDGLRRRYDIPLYCDRSDAAEWIKRIFGVTFSPRTLERSGVPIQIVNGRAVSQTVNWFTFAEAKIAAAPVVVPASRQPAFQEDAGNQSDIITIGANSMTGFESKRSICAAAPEAGAGQVSLSAIRRGPSLDSSGRVGRAPKSPEKERLARSLKHGQTERESS